MRSALMRLVLSHRRKRLEEIGALYDRTLEQKQIAATQLDRFNEHWKLAWRTVPFYRKWRMDHRLPEKIGTLNELAAFPVLTKKVISDERALVGRSPGIARFTLTGGTSGISVPFPMGNADADVAWINAHIGRGWNGIRPHDRLFMIWGHSHLFRGRGAAVKHFKRRVMDGLNNIRRVSAYNLDDAQLENIVRELARCRPKYVIGYGSCLMRFCAYLEARSRTMRDAGIACVINTSESLSPADAESISSALGCPVINEYGMAEAGVIGYSSGSLYPIRIFWNDFILRPINRRLMLTTLGERCFPLINYDTEDLCGDETPATGSLLLISDLLGKARDIFEVKDVDGKSHEVSVILFDHILKPIAPLRSLHYELGANGTVWIRYTTDGGSLDDEHLATRFAEAIKKEGVRIDPAAVRFEWLAQPLQTLAGKRSTLVRAS